MALERDVQLMLRVKEGDEASFALLLERYRAPVMNFIYRMVQNQPVAEELAQEVFLRVYRARNGYEPSARFTTWLFRIATHIALNAIRDRRGERATESLDDGPSPGATLSDPRATVEQVLLEDARLIEIRRAVQALPAKQRAAVLMHKYHEMEYAQIAQVLGCSGVGSEVAAVSGLRNAAPETGSFCPPSPHQRAPGKRWRGRQAMTRSPMKCGKLETLWLPYLDGKLSLPERAVVDAHLAGCPSCAERLEGLRLASQSLESWQAPAASPWFDARLRQKIATDVAPRGLVGWLAAPLRSFPLGIAALLLLAALLIWSGSTRQAPPPELIVSDVKMDELLHVMEEIELINEFEVLGELRKPVQVESR